jgi:hypothetical protein
MYQLTRRLGWLRGHFGRDSEDKLSLPAENLTTDVESVASHSTILTEL